MAPNDADELREIVADAYASHRSLDITAGGTKQSIGRPSQADERLSLERLTGVIDYQPSELVITARPATTLREIEALLTSHNQTFLFEPPDWGDRATFGGTIACNLAGPRRVRAGAARDHFLGFAAINGRGEAWRAGGKVVKNVTGYDMCKLQAGAFGTLSILTELSVRVMPKATTAATVLVYGLSDQDAVTLMATALNTPHEVSAAAHLPPSAAARAGFSGATTALRLEGPPGSVAYRADAIAALAKTGDRLDAQATDRLWSAIGKARVLLADTGILWRLALTPSEAARLAERLRHTFASADLLYDWGGGLLWLSLDEAENPDAGASAIRQAVRTAGGHATLLAAPAPIRAAVPVFEPLEGPLAALTARIKTGFDPRRILNPGRMGDHT